MKSEEATKIFQAPARAFGGLFWVPWGWGGGGLGGSRMFFWGGLGFRGFRVQCFFFGGGGGFGG